MFAARAMMLKTSAAGASYDADAQAWFDAVVAAGSTITDANKSAVSVFVAGCKTDGVWTPIKAACLLCAADSLTGALVPLVGSAPTNNNFVSGDYSRTTGLIGNASTKYLATNRACNADPQDSNHAAVYVHTALSAANQSWIGNAALTTTGSRGAYPNSTSNVRSFASSNAAFSAAVNGTTSTGLVGVSRSGSSAIALRIAQNTSTGTTASATTQSETISVFASGTTRLANCRLSFYSLGENINLALLESRLATLMAALT
jgi:hypothetical protein